MIYGTTTLHELVKGWRASAKRLAKNAHVWEERWTIARTLEECADDLDELIALSAKNTESGASDASASTESK